MYSAFEQAWSMKRALYKFAIIIIITVFVIITDLENIGMDTIFVTVSCILLTILNKIDFSIMEALICI